MTKTSDQLHNHKTDSTNLTSIISSLSQKPTSKITKKTPDSQFQQFPAIKGQIFWKTQLYKCAKNWSFPLQFIFFSGEKGPNGATNQEKECEEEETKI